ncbi:hypothetical protein TSUD_258400 [Trifolium subterraneum]|uniref:Uncharacterized protein n=1 Tax=Trifolium subterraneum TaxID=3900 RepID=A0A2Z6N8A8_TRISU|nr:hypothetical protein TSUD_258400 [Trifolium subterraneum]
MFQLIFNLLSHLLVTKHRNLPSRSSLLCSVVEMYDSDSDDCGYIFWQDSHQAHIMLIPTPTQAAFDGVEDIDILLEEEQPLPGAGVVHEQHELLEYEPHLDEEFLAFLHADDNGSGVDVGDGVDQPPPVVAFVEVGQLLPEHGVGGGGQQVMNIDPPPIAFPEEPYFVGQFFDFCVDELEHGVGVGQQLGVEKAGMLLAEHGVGGGVDQPPPVAFVVEPFFVGQVGVKEAGQLLPEHGVGGGVGINIDPPNIPFVENAQHPFYDEIVFRFLHDNHDDGGDGGGGVDGVGGDE